MPKKVVSTTWECDICGDDYATRKEAVACEREGIIAPAVHIGQSVKVRYPNGDIHGAIVCGITSTFFTSMFYHEGPVSYMVCLENGEVRPADRKMLIPEKSVRHALQPSNVKDWDQFWRAFKRDETEMRKRTRDYLKTHGAKYALRGRKLVFIGKKETKKE